MKQQRYTHQQQYYSSSSSIFIVFTLLLLSLLLNIIPPHHYHSTSISSFVTSFLLHTKHTFQYSYHHRRQHHHHHHLTRGNSFISWNIIHTAATYTAASLSSSLQNSKTTIQRRMSSQTDNIDTTIVEDLDQCTVSNDTKWDYNNVLHKQLAKEQLHVWPLDIYNTILLNEVHPLNYTTTSTTSTVKDSTNIIYDLIAIGSGAGGLVSSKQSARRNAKSALISAHLAGGDCLNVGCVPSKALLRAAKAIREVHRASEFGISFGGETISSNNISIDFAKIMERMRQKRSQIAPADGHDGTTGTGAHVYQGFGTFTGPNTIQVVDSSTKKVTELTFQKAVIATGGRPAIPTNIPGLKEAPYTTNEILFNLETLPPRMIVLGSGIIALEMAQCFATFGSQVTVIQRSSILFQSNYGDVEAAQLLQKELIDSGVQFIHGTVQEVITVRERDMNNTKEHPLMSLSIKKLNDPSNTIINLECECLLIAIGRLPNVENLDLEKANVQYEVNKGVIVNDFAQSTTNPNIYAVGDCVANVPRLTHMSGEMAKLVVQNSLFDDTWKLSSLVVPAVMYTEPEYATVGISSIEMAQQKNIDVDIYRAGLEHNDRAILESNNYGFVKILVRKGTGDIIGATIVAERAGEMINEITLAMKYNLTLRDIGRNIHPYPTMGEAVMGCGIQYINANWKKL